MNQSWLVTSLTTLPVPSGPHFDRPGRDDRGRPRARATGSGAPPSEEGEPTPTGSVDRTGDRRIDDVDSGRSGPPPARGSSPGDSWSGRSTVDPGRSAASAPSSPAMTVSTWSGRGSEVRKMSARAAQSRAEAPALRAGIDGMPERHIVEIECGDLHTRRRSVVGTSGHPSLPSPTKPTTGSCPRRSIMSPTLLFPKFYPPRWIMVNKSSIACNRLSLCIDDMTSIDDDGWSDRTLRVFDAAAREGTLSGAATEDSGSANPRSATPSLGSKVVVGTSVFARSNRGVTLTPLGRRLHEAIRRSVRR